MCSDRQYFSQVSLVTLLVSVTEKCLGAGKPLWFAVFVMLALLGTKDSGLVDYRQHSLHWRFNGTGSIRLASGSSMPAHVMTTVQRVLSTPTGPDDFAAMGSAVNLTSRLLDVAANSNSGNSRLTWPPVIGPSSPLPFR